MLGETSPAQKTAQHEAATDGIDLMQGESVLENRRPSWALWWKQITAAFVFLLGGLSGDAVAGGLLIGGGAFGYVVFSRMQSRYVVTDERVKAKVGILNKVSREYRIKDVQSLTEGQSMFERILGHGTVTFRTSSNDEISWHGVPEYKDVAKTVRRIQRKYEQG